MGGSKIGGQALSNHAATQLLRFTPASTPPLHPGTQLVQDVPQSTLPPTPLSPQLVHDVPQSTLSPTPLSPQLVHDVPQSTLPRERSDADTQPDQQQQGAAAAAGPPPATEYQTVVHTGSKWGAGTDALINMEVRGCSGRGRGG